jgi:type II secretory pathway pseudopilin PulG
MRARIRRALRSEAGFTLVELLTVMLILTFILGGLVVTFTAASTAQADMTRRFTAQQEARLALDKLRREAHCASSATVTGTEQVTLTFPTPAGVQACPAGAGISTVTWCFRAATVGQELYRIASSTTCTGGDRWAEYLVTGGAAFALTLPTSGSGALAKLNVTLPVDLTPNDSVGRYTLQGDIALRNTTRS